MRISKERKGLLVLGAIEDEPKTKTQISDNTGLSHQMVAQGIEWLRDYDPNALVTQWSDRKCYYKLAESADEVETHIHNRAKVLYRMAVRLERMVTIAYERWPNAQLLKIMKRHMSRMREDVEELV